MERSVAQPPLDSTHHCTLVDLADFQARFNPLQPWFLFPSPHNEVETYSVTFAQLNIASHNIAHALRPQRNGAEGTVIALLLHTDSVVSTAVFLGIFRAGLVPYPMSPRNSVTALCAMLEASGCCRILAQGSTLSLAMEAQSMLQSKDIALCIEDLESLRDAISPCLDGLSDANRQCAPYPPHKQQMLPGHPAMFMHSSGSTGLPKTVPLTSKILWQRINQDLLLEARARSVRFAVFGAPSFHMIGFLMLLCYPLITSQAVGVYAPRYPEIPTVLNPHDMYILGRRLNCTGLVAVPSVVECLHGADAMEYLKTLHILVYGGGPLSPPVARKLLDEGVRIYSQYGATEFVTPMKSPWADALSPFAPFQPNPECDYQQISPKSVVRWDSQGDGTYELVVFERDDYNLPFHNVPGLKAYATSDLFEPHPSKDGLWKIVARKDDVVTLSTGEKIVPLQQEGRIRGCPLVNACLVFGRQRAQPGVLIEPRDPLNNPRDHAELSRFREAIWPTIEAANETSPTYAKIFREMIITTDPAKPFPRSSKGIIIRKEALALYAQDIDTLYETVNENTNVDDLMPPETWTEADVVRWIEVQASSLNNYKPVSNSESLFGQGFDSLSATFLRNRLIRTLRVSSSPEAHKAASLIGPDFVYKHPTVYQLVSALLSLLADPLTDLAAQDPVDRNVSLQIDELVQQYSAHISDKATTDAAQHAKSNAPVVLLVGPTGNIGSQTLARLLSCTDISRVYTLHRPGAAPEERLRRNFLERSLPETLINQSNLRTLVGSIDETNFGLQPSDYDEIASTVTHIIHNAWTVDFNLPLGSYEDQISGVRALVDFCARVTRDVKLFFTSSVSIAGRWNHMEGPVPENILDDYNVVPSQGYAASKYVAERILNEATSHGIPAFVIRLGQVCGSRETGAWGTTEWFPMLVKSSVALGCLPDIPGFIDWIPIDAVADTYLNWIFCGQPLPGLVNLVHPQRTPWSIVLKGVQDELELGLPLVPLDRWVAKLDTAAASATADDIARLPALKLLALFRDMAVKGDNQPSLEYSAPRFATTTLEASSVTIRLLQPTDESHARNWVRYWRAIGYIS